MYTVLMGLLTAEKVGVIQRSVTVKNAETKQMGGCVVDRLSVLFPPTPMLGVIRAGVVLARRRGTV